LYFAPLAIESQVFQDAGASGFNNPASEALQEAELLWSTKKHEFILFSLGTGLASLLPDNSNLDNPVAHSDAGNFIQAANKLRSKFKNVTTAKERFEQVAKQLVAVATDTELTHADTAKRFAKW
jgi:hypothetical protein